MSKIHILIILLLLSATCIGAQTFMRANNLFSGNFSNAGIQVNAQGDIYVFGYYHGSITLGHGANAITLSSFSQQFYVAKFNKNQDILWAKSTQGQAMVPSGTAGHIDVAGNLYLTSMISGSSLLNNTKTFGFGEAGQTTITGILFTGGLQGTFFIAKFNSGNGNLMWIKTANSVGINSSIIQGNDLALDNFGNCYVTGYFGGTATFGSLAPVTSTANVDAFVTKFRQSDGVALWVRKGPSGPLSCYGNGIDVDNAGNIYYTGTFGTGTNVLQGNSNTLQVSTTADFDAFVAKYNSNGQVLWASKTQSSGSIGIFPPSTLCADIAVDNQGNSYIIGTIQAQSIQFGSSSITLGNGVPSFYIAKLNTQGQFLWAHGATGGGAGNFAGGNRVSIGSNGNLFVTGVVFGNFWFDNINVINVGPNHDNFIAKYDHLTGNAICMNIPNKGLPSNQAALNDLTTDKQGQVFVDGTNQGSNTYGYIPLASATQKFLATLSEDCCKNQILVQNVTYADPYSGFAVHAANSIAAGFNVGLPIPGDVIAKSGNNVTFAAGVNISLKPGFKALTGSNFHAVITGCTNSNAQ